MQKIRLALLGCGGRSYLAMNAENPAQGYTLAAISDVSIDNMETFNAKFKTKFGRSLPSYSDPLAMIEREKPDGVLVLTPDFVHEENAVKILKLGLPVYLEKPLAISVESCDRILAAAKNYRAKLMVGHNMRYMKFTRKIKEIIDSGAIGEVRAIWVRHFVNYGGDAYFTRWMSDRSKVNSLLLQKGAHDIDIIHWFANSITRRVIGMGNLTVYNHCHRRPSGTPYVSPYPGQAIWPPETQRNMNPVIDVNDHNMIMLQLANGVQAVYAQCFYTPDACRNYTVIGTRGRLENYGDYCGDSTVEVWNQRHIERVFNMHGDYSYDVTPPPHATHGGADGIILAEFVEYLRGNVTPVIRPQMSRYSVAAGCAGAESIRRGSQPVDVPLLPEDLENWQY